MEVGTKLKGLTLSPSPENANTRHTWHLEVASLSLGQVVEEGSGLGSALWKVTLSIWLRERS